MVPRLRKTLVSGCLAWVIASIPLTSTEWRTFHGDSWRRGDAPVNVVIPVVSEVPPRLRWKHRIGSGAGLSAVLADVSGDKRLEVIVGSADNSLHCIDASGRLLWKAPTHGPVLAAPTVTLVGENTGPVIFFADIDGYLFSCNGTGQRLWRSWIGGRTVSSPAAADLEGKGKTEVIIGNTAGEIVSVSAEKGKVGWRYSTNGAVEAPPSLADLDNDGKIEIIVGSRDGFLYCLQSNGRLKWKFSTGGDILGAAAVAFLTGERELSVLVGSGGGYLYCIDKDGKQRWRWRAGVPVNSTPAVADLGGDEEIRVVFGTADGRVVCLDRQGQPLWSFAAEPGYEVYSSPVVADLDSDGLQEIYFGSYDSSIYRLGPDGRPRWRFKTGGSVEATAAVGDLDSDGAPEFTISSLDGNLYLFETGQGFPRELLVRPLTHPEWQTLASDCYVTAIEIDGPMVWIAAGGVLCYDSRSGTYTRFGPEHGLAEASVTCIGIGRDHAWFGTRQAGLSRFNKATGQWRTFTTNDGLAGNNVTAIAIDGHRVWVGTTGSGLSVFHEESKQWCSYSETDGLPDSSVAALAVGEGEVWVGTSRGISRLDQEAHRWEKYGPSEGLPHPLVTALSTSGERVLAATGGGIAEFDRKRNSWVSIGGRDGMGKPLSLLAESDGFLVGTERGIRRFDERTAAWQALPGLPIGTAVPCLAKQGKLLWVGTLGNGLYCLDQGSGRWARTRSAGLPSSGVNAIAFGDQEVWIATGGGVKNWRGGLNRLDRRTGEWQAWTGHDGISHWAVNAVILEGERVWIATRGGLDLFLPRTARWRKWWQEQGRQDNFFVSLAVGMGRVWFGTDKAGAGYINIDNGEINFLQPPQGWGPRAVEAIILDGETVWFACWDGARRYHPKSGKWGAVRTADGLVYPVVWTIGVDGEDYLWFGTTCGLSRFSKKNGTFETFDRTCGLPDDLVWTTAVGEESVYFGTANGGLAAFWKRNATWQVVTSSDGLASDEVYCVALPDQQSVAGKDELWVGTYGGISRRVYR